MGVRFHVELDPLPDLKEDYSGLTDDQITLLVEENEREQVQLIKRLSEVKARGNILNDEWCDRHLGGE